ncbi:MAG: sulfatase-like hydrolase/transferase, partial [Chloroflexota bacterium]|nr:sulfatase-like hydrolase/transferase [Chloroflexota bacterium]
MPRRPNIILFMTDSMDGRVMRHLGHPAAHPPHLGRLAPLGTSFRNAYCNSPQCAPSRASFWSGQYVHRVQAWNNPGGLPMDAPTFGTHLQDAGYGLHVFGKTDYRVGGHSLKARLTAWIRSANIKRPHNPRPQAVTVQPDTPRLHEKDWLQIDNTCQFLNNYSKDDPPYFCYPSTNVPHPP